MTELDRIRIATMFATDAQLDLRPRAPSFLHRDLHQFTDAGLIDRGKRIFLYDFQFLVRREEGARIVAAHAEAGLREIVGAETEKLRGLGNLIRSERAARDFNH